MSIPDTRRIATRHEVESSLQDDEYGDWFADQFALWDNPRFAGLQWSSLGDLRGRITPSQLTLLSVSTLINQVANGGLEQCFFNYESDAPLLRTQIDALGWPELSDRFKEKFEAAFETTNTKGLLQTLKAAEHEGSDVGDPEAKPFSHFVKIYDVFDFDDFNEWLLVEGYPGLTARLKAFIRANEAELFDVTDD